MEIKLLTVDQVSSENEFEFFWGGIYSQWALYNFTDDCGITYNCAEQYMMAQKAKVFNDMNTYSLIMNTFDPKKQKSFGRHVKNFSDMEWDKHKLKIVHDANYFKFSQHPELKKLLLSTEDKILVEASPYDKIWGIGLREGNPDCNDPKLWKGLNLLGFAITQVREELKSKESDEKD